MLNLFVRLMKKRLILLPFFLFLIAAQDSTVAITSPMPDEALRGQVNIIGSTNLPNFVSAQLDFAYATDITPNGGGTGTWFPLQALSQPVFDSPLYTWDTTSITDGEYLLRLRVFTSDGGVQEVTVPVTVQNDAVPTPTLAPTSTAEAVINQMPTPFLLAASPTPTEVPRPTPTPMPTNAAALDQNEIYTSLGRGALVILGLFALAGVILRLRRF
jgi:hypothetical protein